MSLTAPVLYNMKQRNPEEINRYPVRNGVTIYYGALVGLSTVGVTDGRLVNWSSGSGALRFLGIAIPHGTADAPSTVTGNSGGSVECEVYEGGPTLENISVTGATSQQTEGDPVYASDENTFTLSATSNVSAVGRVARWRSSGKADVQLYSAMEYNALAEVGKV